jgi:hypothetical protein
LNTLDFPQPGEPTKTTTSGAVEWDIRDGIGSKLTGQIAFSRK